MRIRWSRKHAFPLLLLALLYTAGAGQLARSYSRCDLNQPEGLAAGIGWAKDGWGWFSQASSRLRLGSWLGNAWAPGSLGWSAAAPSTPEPAGRQPHSGFSPLAAQAATSFEAFESRWPQVEALPTVDGAQTIHVADCGTRPVVVLARPEVVIVTAEFPRLPISQLELADLPDRIDSADPAQLPLRIGCRRQPLIPDPSTI